MTVWTWSEISKTGFLASRSTCICDSVPSTLTNLDMQGTVSSSVEAGLICIETDPEIDPTVNSYYWHFKFFHEGLVISVTIFPFHQENMSV